MARSFDIGVCDLCAFLLRHGDLRSGWPGGAEPWADEHTRQARDTHAREVASRASRPGWAAEVGVTQTGPGFRVNGRADAVAASRGALSVEEIKCTRFPEVAAGGEAQPEPAALLGLAPQARGDRGGRCLDWAQAMCYAAMLVEGTRAATADVALRYVDPAGNQARELHRVYAAQDLQAFLSAILARYGHWVASAREWEAQRDASLAGLGFPFPTPRAGQDQLMQAVQAAIAQGERLYVRAPTGLGKTVAVLYPALRALAQPDQKTDRVFYLTPRGTAALAVRETLEVLRAAGLRLRAVFLAAKERTCPVGPCQPGLCRYARGHHDRILDALAKVLTGHTIDTDTLREVAEAHRVCPHGLGREAAEWCDLVVGDCKYVFDPGVALRRFQDPWGPFAARQVYLVDEAHQLPDRAREMYSASLSAARLGQLAAGVEAGWPPLAQALHALTCGLQQAAEQSEAMASPDGQAVGWLRTPPAALLGPLEDGAAEGIRWLEDWAGAAAPPDAANAVMELLRFRGTLDQYDDRYATLVRAQEAGLVVELACLDPSAQLWQRLAHARSTVFFSATLTPPEHYVRLLGGDAAAAASQSERRTAASRTPRRRVPAGPVATSSLTLRSPFPRENLLVVVDGSLSNRYRDRPASAPKVARLVARVAACRSGPYLAFLPSYAYLERVYTAFRRLESGVTTVVQTPAMSPGDREAFLEALKAEDTVVGFVVMGGLFAEAIDLPGDRLVGAIVAGTGLPPPRPQTELIRAYHEDRGGDGFERAYLCPGLSRVLQAAGRVIRGPGDRGVVVLADSRFAGAPYREHLPPEWEPLVVAQGARALVAEVRGFWRRVEQGSAQRAGSRRGANPNPGH